MFALKPFVKRRAVSLALVGSMALGPAVGCSNLPGGSKEQGAVIGGLGGAAAGALIGKNNRGLGALIGGVLGAGGGYLIGAHKDKIDKQKAEEAREASERAERNPARPDDVPRSRTADLNDDGFVTMDEVVALRKAGLSDSEMIDRLQRTDQVFELTDRQVEYLRDRNVSTRVIDAMQDMNRDEDRARTASSDRSDSRDRYDDRYDRSTRDDTLSRDRY
jgi:Glycine zipper